MAGNKQKSLTRLDNNYELNLRYPDINDFLKDTLYSSQDNQTYGRTLLTNPRLQVGSAKQVETIIVAGYSIEFLLSNLIIYGFSPDQELFYDFAIAPEIFGVSLTEFKADRTTEGARLQSVQSFSLDKPESVANFSISLSSKKIADLLTELFTYHSEELKVELDLADDASLVAYVLQNLLSLSFTFFCSYRLSRAGDYENGFRVPVALSYLKASVLDQIAITAAKIDLINYTPTEVSEGTAAPKIAFKGIYNLNGELQLTQINNSSIYVDSAKINVTQSTKQLQFTSNFRTADYVWKTISGVENTPPLVTYNYTFAVKNSTKKYAGIFGTFESPANTAGAFALKTSNYAVQLKNYKESGTNANKYAITVSFAISNSNSKQTGLNTLFKIYTKNGINVTDAPNLFLKMELLNPADKTNVFAPNAAYERSVFLTTLNPRNLYTVNESRQLTLSGCFLFASANTDANRSQFSKTVQRVQSTYSGVPNFASTALGIIAPQVSLTVSTVNPKGLLAVNLQWPSLSASELAALHQLTTASGIKVSLLDSFMNVLAVTDKVYDTANKLERSESSLVNPLITYSAEVDYTNVLLNSEAKNPIKGLMTAVNRGVAPYIRILTGPTVKINRLLEYIVPDFTLRDNIYCIAQWIEPSQFDKSPTEKWGLVLHKPTESQIDITNSGIAVSAAQKVSLAQSLFVHITKRPAVYSIYILLPWTTVRDTNNKKSIIRSELISGKYTYAYAIKV